MKIVLGTSTGKDQKGRYIINYPSRWTSTVDRNPFYFYPFQLAYASTLLKQETSCQVKLIDAGIRQLDRHAYADLLITEKPDILVIESSSRCIDDDVAVVKLVKKEIDSHTVFVGQPATGFSEKMNAVVDSIISGEYELTLLNLIQKLSSGNSIEKLPGVYPNPWSGELPEIKSLPWPEDEDISRLDYIGPLPGHKYKQIQMYASRGCTMKCNYCVAANTYYQKPNWRPREVDDVITEMQYLVKKYGDSFEGIFFDEEAHFLNKNFILKLCDKIASNGLNYLKITAMGMYFSLDKEVLKAMKAAGYCQLKLGIETASAETATAVGLGKKFNIQKLHSVLGTARELGIETYGTFQVGLSGSTYEEDMKTAELVRELLEKDLLCEMQISISTPQPGTPFYRECLKNNYLVTDDWEEYDGLVQSVVSYPHYSKEQIEKVFRVIRDIGYHVRGLRDLKNNGLIYTARRSLQRVGIRGVFKHLKDYHFGSRRHGG